MDLINQIDDAIVAAAGLSVQLFVEASNSRTAPTILVNPYLQERSEKGRFNTDFEDMYRNPKVFKENFHMQPSVFDDLFELVVEQISSKRNTRPHDKISPKEKLAIVLEYLASGSLQRHVSSIYRISKQHFGTVLDDVCSAICTALEGEFPPIEKSSFVRIANDFNAIWNFPNCVGAIDGKHVAIKCPGNAGTLFYNYKGFHSIVLMAASDASYRFITVDIGAHGSEGDANVFLASNLGKGVLHDKFPFPEDMYIGNKKIPYFFVGDDAFPLNKRLIKPYAPRKPQRLTDEERIFNYRLSRARRCVENSFGILCSKFLCLARTMFCGPDRAQKIIAACCYLHNYLLRTSKDSYCPRNYADYYNKDGILIEGEWRKKIPSDSLYTAKIKTTASGRQNNIGKHIRDQMKEYVNSNAGSLSWQRRAVFLE